MIERSSLRTQVGDVVRKWITEGKLRPGIRIQEPKMAAQLGVSRTPLREALFQLERDGLVRSDPGKGFRVVPISVAMIREAYPILGALERLALHSSGPVVKRACGELRRINDMGQCHS